MKDPDLHKDDMPEGLKKLKGTNPFRVPEGYFQELEDNVLDRWGQEQQPLKNHGVGSMWYRWMAIGGAVAAAALLLVFFRGLESSDRPEAITWELTEQELLNYVTENISEFSEEDFYSLESLDFQEDLLLDVDDLDSDQFEFIYDQLAEDPELDLWEEI